MKEERTKFDHPIRRDAVLRCTSDMENVEPIVVISERFRNLDTGYIEYKLTDGTNTQYWRYHEEDVDDLFVLTGLVREEPKLVMQADGRDLLQEYCEHTWHTVHDRETLEPVADECFHCRARREPTEVEA